MALGLLGNFIILLASTAPAARVVSKRSRKGIFILPFPLYYKILRIGIY